MSTEDRILQLETRVRALSRTLRVGACLVIAALVGGIACDHVPSATSTSLAPLVGSSLELRTADGRLWLSANSRDGGGALRLHSTDDMGGIELAAEPGQNVIGLWNGQLFPLVTLSLIDDDTPMLMMLRPDLSASVVIGTHPDDHGFGVFVDPSRQRLATIPEWTRWPLPRVDLFEDEPNDDDED